MLVRPCLSPLLVLAVLTLAHGGILPLPRGTGSAQEAYRHTPVRVRGLDAIQHLSMDELREELRHLKVSSVTVYS